MKKKKLLEKDGFYLALFACVCLVAVGGVFVTKNSIDKLTAETGFLNHGDDKIAKGNEDDEIHLIEKEKEKDSVATSTESKEKLEDAKKKETEVTKEEATKTDATLPVSGTVSREYSETVPSKSETLGHWEIHKALDIKADKGSDIKSIVAGKVVDVYNDQNHGMSIKIESTDKTVVIYSNLDKKVSVKKGDAIKLGQIIGKVGNTSVVESVEGPHVHIEASKNGKAINPMNLMK